jgi:hypothetical protein
MRMEKLFFGVLRVLTHLGPRYLNSSLAARLYQLWIFRNFETLPIKVLNRRQQRRIEAMCARQGFVSGLEANGLLDTPQLGTFEQRPPVASPGRPNRSITDAEAPFAPESGG